MASALAGTHPPAVEVLQRDRPRSFLVVYVADGGSDDRFGNRGGFFGLGDHVAALESSLASFWSYAFLFAVSLRTSHAAFSWT